MLLAFGTISYSQTIFDFGFDPVVLDKEKGWDLSASISTNERMLGLESMRIGAVIEHYNKRHFTSGYFTLEWSKDFLDKKIIGTIGIQSGMIARDGVPVHPRTTNTRTRTRVYYSHGVNATLRWFPDKLSGVGLFARFTNLSRYDMVHLYGQGADNNRVNGTLGISYRR